MKYFVIEPFTLETPQGSATLPAGKILELSLDQAARLKGKVELLIEGRDLPHWCSQSESWCSAKLTGSCVRPECEYYKD